MVEHQSYMSNEHHYNHTFPFKINITSVNEGWIGF